MTYRMDRSYLPVCFLFSVNDDVIRLTHVLRHVRVLRMIDETQAACKLA